MNNLSDTLQEVVDKIPFAKNIGLFVVDAREGFISVRVSPQLHLFNHFGFYQAGIYLTLAEITGGLLFGTFLDLSKNFMITKRSEINFTQASNSQIFASASMSSIDISEFMDSLKSRKKMDKSIDVVIKNENAEVIASCLSHYYLRMGIPKSFSLKSSANPPT